MRVAIVQSSYIPWRGYFAIIARCDAFVFLDSVQFTRRDWRTRNRIKTPDGLCWLSIPVHQRGAYHAPINAMTIADATWWRRHLRSIELSYRRAAGFAAAFDGLAAAYHAAGGETMLSLVNQRLTGALCAMMGIGTRLTRDTDLVAAESLAAMDATERLVAIAHAANADEYLSGPAARAYLDEAAFNRRGIRVSWMDYTNLPRYPQLWGEFEPAVSIVDALLNLGPAGAREALDA